MSDSLRAAARAFRASIFHLRDDPGPAGDPRAAEFLDDGLLVVEAGRVAQLGHYASLAPGLAAGTPVEDLRGKWIVPGFVDTHVHSAQLAVIASPGEQLLAWLERYTFPEEGRFGDPAYARVMAEAFLEELLRNGTTTAVVFPTVHEGAADALFAAAHALDMRLIAGKVLMDRNCPEFLRDTPEAGYDASLRLIERWHRRGRLAYAVTPRFAATSSERQLELAGRLYREHPGLYLQSHVAENLDEVRWVGELFPAARSYLDVYDRFGLLGPRAVYAHCIHLDRADRERLAASGAAMAFCPTSNLFLGSGLFDRAAARAAGAHVAIGTDVGGGTSFSMLRTLAEGYKALQLQGQPLSSLEAFYLATLGAARALELDRVIGNLAPGKEADFVVLDPSATPLLERRFARAADLAERLFVLLMLGDDRAVSETYLLGRRVHRRDR
jgi:guanine deaminase